MDVHRDVMFVCFQKRLVSVKWLMLPALMLLTSLLQAQQEAMESPAGTKFWAYTPPSYNDIGPGSPLLVVLHGGSGIGDDLNIITQNIQSSPDNSHLTPARLIYQGRWDTSLPFVVVSPQLKRDLSVPNYNDQKWPASMVNEVIEYVKQQYNIDETRIYMSGISLGGNGTWNYAALYPGQVAAIAPFSGVTNLEQACFLKDIPIWAFHGENDALVVPDFSINMIDDINSCQPSGVFKPNLTLMLTQMHEGWNEMYTGSNTYDLYSWLLKFQKGINANRTPFVTAGGDRTILLASDPLYITGDFFDSDGSITSVLWTQQSGPAVTLEGTSTRRLKVSSLSTGTFVFRLTVTDDDGASSMDEMVLTVTNDATVPTILSLTLTDRLKSPIRLLTQDDVINLSDLGMFGINIMATGNSATGSIRFSVDAFDNIVTQTANAQKNTYLRAGSGQEWKPSDGEFVICATAYSGNGGSGQKGNTLCYKISVSRDSYYAKNGMDVSLLSSWSNTPDGNGTPPASFTTTPYNYVVAGSANVGSQAVMHTDSKIRVVSGGQLTFNARFVLPFVPPATPNAFKNVYAEGNSTITVFAPDVFFGGLSEQSTVIMGAGTIRFQPAVFGNLIIRGNGVKTPSNGAIVTVRRTMTIEPGAGLANSGIDNAEFLVLGTFDMQSTLVPALDAAYPLRFGGQSPVLKFTPSPMILKGLTVHANTTLNIERPSPGTIEINSTQNLNDQGELIVEDGGTLKLNGHALEIRNTVDMNPDTQTGAIELGDSPLIIDVNGSKNLFLFPKRGHHTIPILDFSSSSPGVRLILGDSLKITDHVLLANSDIESNGFLKLVSQNQQHAATVVREGTGRITGVVNVERFIEPGKKWKYVGFPVNGLEVRDLQNYIPVTGSFTGSDTGPGLSNNPSLYYYSEPQGGWIAYPTTNDQAQLDLGRGYAVFMRNETLPDKMVASGTLHFGDFPFALDANASQSGDQGWNLLGNPYPSSIIWGALGWTSQQVSQTVSIKDNSGEGGVAFRIWDGEVGDVEFGGVISSGQAFWVRTLGSTPQLIVSEQAQTTDQSKFYRTGTGEVSVLKLTLEKAQLQDNIYMKFNINGKPGIDDLRDGVKQKNDYFNISVLSSEGIPIALKNLSDTLCIHQTELLFEPDEPGTFTLTSAGSAFEKTMTRLVLEDHHRDSLVQLEDGTQYSFTVDNNSSSSAGNRFKLWIETRSIPDPVITFSNGVLSSGVEKGNQWFLDGVEIPGATGSQFTPSEEGEYHVVVNKGGCIKSSGKYAFRITSAANGFERISIYPNPAKAQVFLRGTPGDIVTYDVVSVAGSSIKRGEVSFLDRDTGVINTDDLSPGIYILHLQTREGSLQYKLFIQ